MDPSGDIRFSPAGLAVIGTLLTALAATVRKLYLDGLAANAARYDQLLKESAADKTEAARDRDAREADLKKERDTVRNMLVSAVANLEIAAGQARKLRGIAPLDKVADVVPEANSPPTQEQIDTADLATLRARLTAASLSLGLPPRTPGATVSAATADAVKNTIGDYLRGHHASATDSSDDIPVYRPEANPTPDAPGNVTIAPAPAD